VSEAFFVPDGDRFVPTAWTRGPWSADAQHAGPAAALAARAIERLDPVGELQVARFTLEVLRALPLEPLRVEATTVRAGRRVQFEQAVLRTDDDREVARATAWRIRPAAEPVPERNLEAPPFPGPADSTQPPTWDPGWSPSYFEAIDWRYARGAFFRPGPGAAWMRMRIALVAGEQPSPLTRVLVAADSGNGVSIELPLDAFLSVNTELTVHLARLPEGEWVCLDAVTRIGPEGVGLAQSVLWDERGRLGSGNQSLLVAPR
jgi:Thioesterase-like superfamily